MINKIKTIIFSRFKKPNKKSFVEVRREICAKCEYNTKNIETLKWNVKAIKFLSDLYSFLTLSKKVDVLGNCTACSICSIYYKTAEELEECKAKPARWERVVLKKQV